MDEFGHLIRHAASMGGEATPFRYGHIASYDPMQHRVRCIIPSLNDQDGVPLLSNWMPMGTLSAGAGFGVQVIYRGGATVTNPTDGEQVMIGVFDRQRGVAAVPCMFYHASNQPPATNLPTMQDGYSGAADPVVPGDLIISAPPAQEGGANSFIRLRQSGAIQIWSAGQVSADVIGGVSVVVNTGNVDLTVAQGDATVAVTQGNATLQAAQTVNIIGAAIRLSSALADALQQLCNAAFWTNFNTHTHNRGAPPDQPATESMLTQTVTAE